MKGRKKEWEIFDFAISQAFQSNFRNLQFLSFWTFRVLWEAIRLNWRLTQDSSTSHANIFDDIFYAFSELPPIVTFWDLFLPARSMRRLVSIEIYSREILDAERVWSLDFYFAKLPNLFRYSPILPWTVRFLSIFVSDNGFNQKAFQPNQSQSCTIQTIPALDRSILLNKRSLYFFLL